MRYSLAKTLYKLANPSRASLGRHAGYLGYRAKLYGVAGQITEVSEILKKVVMEVEEKFYTN